jgi:hypothetical protein
MKKNTRISKVQKMENYIKSVMKFFNCDVINVINGTKWYGEYGRVCYLEGNKLVINRFEKLSNVYKTVHKIFNNTGIYQDDRVFVSYRWNTPSLILLEGAKDISEGNGLYKLSNGQLYDAYDMFWFSCGQSKVLKKWLKGGYAYYNPQEFCTDYYKELDKE